MVGGARVMRKLFTILDMLSIRLYSILAPQGLVYRHRPIHFFVKAHLLHTHTHMQKATEKLICIHLS